MIRSKVARRYAKAIFSLGKEDGNFEQYGKELKEFSNLLEQNRELSIFLLSRLIPLESRQGVLKKVLEKVGFSEVTNRFLMLLLEKERMDQLDGIWRYYEKLMDEAMNIVRAEIITPMPLSDSQREKLENALATFTGKKVKSVIETDPSLIGGVVVKIGDMVLDGSIKAQLEGLKQSI